MGRQFLARRLQPSQCEQGRFGGGEHCAEQQQQSDKDWKKCHSIEAPISCFCTQSARNWSQPCLCTAAASPVAFTRSACLPRVISPMHRTFTPSRRLNCASEICGRRQKSNS